MVHIVPMMVRGYIWYDIHVLYVGYVFLSISGELIQGSDNTLLVQKGNDFMLACQATVNEVGLSLKEMKFYIVHISVYNMLI